jgi:multidrug efflux pump subunit AcrB
VRLYDTMNSHRDWASPQLGVGEPIIKPKGIDDVPIVTLTFWTKDVARAAFEMQQVARAVEIEMKRIPGTRDVVTLGGPGHVIRVAMDAERMNRAWRHRAGPQAPRCSSPTPCSPPAAWSPATARCSVETGTYLETAADVKRLVVGVQDGRPVFMSDVARDQTTAPTSPRNTSGTAPRRANSPPSPCRSPRSPA